VIKPAVTANASTIAVAATHGSRVRNGSRRGLSDTRAE
jgi:hypothetical protein